MNIFTTGLRNSGAGPNWAWPLKKNGQGISRKKKSGEEGFSLLEVLIAIAIIGMVVLSVNLFNDPSESAAMNDLRKEIERLIDHASNESILRNTITRIHIFPSTDSETEKFAYEVQYQKESNDVLPNVKDSVDEEDEKLTLSDLEKRDKILNELSKRFQPTELFLKGPKEFPEKMNFIGLANQIRNGVILFQEASIYFYPNGERDHGLIIVGSAKEVMALELQPFHPKNYVKFKSLTKSQTANNSEEEIITEQENLAKEIYEFWREHGTLKENK